MICLVSLRSWQTETLGFDKFVLPMKYKGAEAVGNRRLKKYAENWAYEKRESPEKSSPNYRLVKINFTDVQPLLSQFSNDSVAQQNYGPYTKGFIKIEYDNQRPLQEVVEKQCKTSRVLGDPFKGSRM